MIHYTLLGASVVFFVYQILFNYHIEHNIQAFPDSNDYIFQSEQALFSFDFISPTPNECFSPRPFTVPLLYKMVGSKASNIVVMQKIMYCISILSLMFSLANFIDNYLLKLFSAILLLYFFSWWNIVGWSNIVLSESLSLSFFFLWVASILFHYKNRSILSFCCLIGISLLLSFTRDTWSYIIFSFAVIDLFASLIFKSKAVKKTLYFFAFSLVLFFSQNYTSSIGERYKLPLFNTIVGRISQNEANVLWFKKEGMPLSDIITRDFKGFNIDDDYNTRSLVYSKYKDVSYQPLFNWILKDGKLVYQFFLITHPSYFFLNDQTDTQTHRVFCTTLLEYIQKPEGFYLLANGTFPYFSPMVLFICLIILSVLYVYQKHKILLFPCILVVLCIVNALISYNADALEVKRHLFNTQIIIDFVGILSLIFILNELMIIYKNSLIYLRSKNKYLLKD